MDTSIAQNTLSNADTSASSSPRTIFFATYRQSQPWPFPDSLIYYITKNPSSPKCCEKMIQSCKHFFIKKPILVVRKLFLKHRNNKWEARLNERNVDFYKIISKIWIMNEIKIFNNNHTEPYLLSPIISKFFRSDVKELYLCCQNIYFNDLKFLASSTCEKVELTSVTVMNQNGSVIQLEDVIQAFPKCKSFEYNFVYISVLNTEHFTSKTAEKLCKIPHFKNLRYFDLSGITEVFDIVAFYDNYIKRKTFTLSCTINRLKLYQPVKKI